MVSRVNEDLVAAFNLLNERNKTLVYELIKSLAPGDSDDVASPSDLAAYATALEELKRGDCIPRSAYS